MTKSNKLFKIIWRNAPWRAKSFAVRKMPGHFLRDMNVVVTSRCNLKCTFCNIGARSARESRDNSDLSLDNVRKNLFGERIFHTVTQVHLTGGEPFLREDLIDLCEEFALHCPNAHFSIVTNGTLSERILKFCQAASRRSFYEKIHLGISLDAIGDLHDEIRGVGGTYNRVIETIKRTKESYPGMLNSLSFTIIPENVDHLHRVYELAREGGLEFYYRIAQESSFYYGDNRGCLSGWNDVKLAELEKSITHMCYGGSEENCSQEINVLFFKNMVEAYRLKERHYDCFAGLCLVLIDSDGNIRPCSMLDVTLGNIAENDLLTVLRSKRAEDVRRYIAERKCFCWIECLTFSSWGTAAWLGMPIRDQLRTYERRT